MIRTAILAALIATSIASAPFAQQAVKGEGVYVDPAQAESLKRNSRISAQRAAEMEKQALKVAADTVRDEKRIEAIENEIVQLEGVVSEKRAELVALANEEAGASEALRVRRRQNAAAYSAMVALSKANAPELVAYNGDALRAARGASALAGLREALERDARGTLTRVKRIEDLRLETEGAREATKEAIEALRERERELWVLVGKRKELQRETMEQADALKREAENLTARAKRLQRLTQRSPAPLQKPTRRAMVQPSQRILPPPLPLRQARGQFLWPVTGGEIAQEFGQAQTGNEALGMVFDAKPYALVYAPWNGTLSYAGPVNSFGLVAVIDIGEDYQIVLAGLSDLIRKKGDPVQRGEPIGTLTGPISESEEFLADESALSANAVASLYLQMRLRGAPIDPGEWFGPSGGQMIRKVDAQ